jgi:hypothetical protein
MECPHLNPSLTIVWYWYLLLPFVAVSLPPPLPFSEETGSPSNDVQPNHRGIPHLSPHRIFGYRDYKRRLVFLSSLMFQGKFSIVFLSKYKYKKLCGSESQMAVNVL